MKQERMTVVSQKQLAPRIFQLTLQGKLVREMQKAGQFLHIKVPRADLLLRRPISINQIHPATETCSIIYRVEGAGTEELAQLTRGAQLDVMGPLGNGFTSDFLTAGQTAYVIGGGIGIPPMYELTQRLHAQGVRVTHFLGYASQEVAYFQEEFQALGETLIATDDGSLGVHGNVGDLLRQKLTIEQPNAVYACGANGMLKAVANLFPQHEHVYLSMEQRMACGMGACYACVCHVPENTEGKLSKKVCDEGPIFNANEVIL